MHILLTNDDGLYHPGLLALKQALEPLGQITVIAPGRNFSAAGHRKTMHKPLRLDPAYLADGSPAWVCSGAPSDCVALGLLGFVRDPVDVVVSGINPHANLGQDVTYSGTVTAAFEAVIAGVPGIAVSTEAGQPPNFAPAARMAHTVIDALAQKQQLARNLLLNLNVPTNCQGLRITRQGRREYRDALVTRMDPRGRPYYWIGGEFPAGQPEEGTDIWAMTHGFASLTPMHLDLTHYAAQSALSWLES